MDLSFVKYFVDTKCKSPLDLEIHDPLSYLKNSNNYILYRYLIIGYGRSLSNKKDK